MAEAKVGGRRSRLITTLDPSMMCAIKSRTDMWGSRPGLSPSRRARRVRVQRFGWSWTPRSPISKEASNTFAWTPSKEMRTILSWVILMKIGSTSTTSSLWVRWSNLALRIQRPWCSSNRSSLICNKCLSFRISRVGIQGIRQLSIRRIWRRCCRRIRVRIHPISQFVQTVWH